MVRSPGVGIWGKQIIFPLSDQTHLGSGDKAMSRTALVPALLGFTVPRGRETTNRSHMWREQWRKAYSVIGQWMYCRGWSEKGPWGSTQKDQLIQGSWEIGQFDLFGEQGGLHVAGAKKREGRVEDMSLKMWVRVQNWPDFMGKSLDIIHRQLKVSEGC